MSATDLKQRGESRRFRIAYLKINLGLTLKEIAYHLAINESTVEHHWAMAKRQIRKGTA